MGALAHKVGADLAQGLPRRVSSPVERLQGAGSNPGADHREGSVLAGSGRADPSCGGPRSRPGMVSLTYHCIMVGITHGVQAPHPGSAAPVAGGWGRDDGARLNVGPLIQACWEGQIVS
jgi:hypothetical protein